MFSGYLPINTTITTYIHYWFVEAETAPETAPVVWWSNGGPGCSGLIGFGTEHGPFHFHGDGILTPNEYSWNKFANMLYVSQPVGVGFSYTEEKAGKITDARAAEDNYRTILSFFEKFPNLKGNEFYVSSESYGGALHTSVNEDDFEGGYGTRDKLPWFCGGQSVRGSLQ